MSGATYQSVNVKAPFGDGTNPTSCRRFTCDSTSRANAIPVDWAGKYVFLTNETANEARFFFSKNASATCDETVAATDAGASSASLGGPLLGSSTRHVRVPSVAPGESLYFVRASVTTTTITIELASD